MNPSPTSARLRDRASPKQRNATARRLLAGIKKISGAGMRAFTADPTLYEAFQALANKVAG
jgi:hypothetical protein